MTRDVETIVVCCWAAVCKCVVKPEIIMCERHSGWMYRMYRIVIPQQTWKLYNICTILDQRRRRWADVVQMLYNCFVFADIVPYLCISSECLQTHSSLAIYWQLLGHSLGKSDHRLKVFFSNTTRSVQVEHDITGLATIYTMKITCSSFISSIHCRIITIITISVLYICSFLMTHKSA